MTTLVELYSAVERLNYLFGGASEAAIKEVLEGIEQLKSDLGQMAKGLSAANDKLGTEVNRQVRELANDIEDSAERFIFRQALEALSSASLWSDLRFFCSTKAKSFVEDVQVFSRRARALVDSFGDKGSLSSKGGDNHNRPTARLQLIDPHDIREPGPMAFEGYTGNFMEALVGGGEGLSVTAICGMGGIGKTTLAMSVFNHTVVRKHFECLAWSTVTQNYQPRNIFVSVLTTISWEANHSKIAAMDTMELFETVHKSLIGKRYLIVLDDVWSAEAWDSLRYVFPDCRNRSRIVITTRSMEVARYTSTSPIQMKMLTDQQSWELFQIKSGLQDYPGKSNPRLEEIQEKIVRSCQGLPLAITVIGQILSRENLQDWELILRELHSVDNTIHQSLDLSYRILPSHLKPCFLYLGCFPCDHPVMVAKLHLLWMAEGLISKRMEAAENYFSELVDRNLVIVEEKEDLLTSRRSTSCRVHDLIRDICISRGKQEEFLKVVDSSHANKISSSTCRLAVYMNKFEDMNNITLGIPRVNRIRSILFFDTVKPMPKSTWPNEVADLTNSERLRVLDFDGVDFQVKKLPRGIGNLRYLRHLSFQGCYLEELPSSFGNFAFLETLDLRVIDYCIMTIPNVLRKLSRLRHLYFPLAFRCVGKDKLQLDGLKNLEVLQNFHASSCDAGDLLELENLQNLKVTVDGNNLDLSNFINSIKKMKSIRHSSLVVKRFDCYSKERFSIVTELFECTVLHALDLEGDLGAFPHDIVFGLNFSEMVFNGSEFKENPMTILGKLPNLKRLVLCNGAFLGPNLVCYESDFPQLTSLKLATLQSLEEWAVESGAMPILTILTIEQCDKLEMLPSGLVEIPTLRKLKIGSMPKLFLQRVKEIIEGEMSNGNGETFSATFYDC